MWPTTFKGKGVTVGKTRSSVYALRLCHVFAYIYTWSKACLFCACIVPTSIISLVLETSFNPVFSVLVIKVQVGPWLCLQSSSFFDSRLDLPIQNDDWKLESSLVHAPFIGFSLFLFTFFSIYSLYQCLTSWASHSSWMRWEPLGVRKLDNPIPSEICR